MVKYKNDMDFLHTVLDIYFHILLNQKSIDLFGIYLNVLTNVPALSKAIPRVKCYSTIHFLIQVVDYLQFYYLFFTQHNRLL